MALSREPRVERVGARPGRRSSQAAARRPAVAIATLIPKARPSKTSSARRPRAEAGGEDAARERRGRPGTWWASDGSLRSGPVGRAARPRRSGLGRCARTVVCRPRPWHHAASDDRPGRALRPVRRRLRTVVGARPGAGGRDARSSGSPGRRSTPGARMLDVGTGTGQLAIATLERWPATTVDGVDVSAGMMVGRRTPRPTAGSRPTTARGSARRSPRRTACRSTTAPSTLALSSFVLQLVPNRHRALRDIRRVLRPGGTFASVTWLADRVVFAPDEAFDDALEDVGEEPRGWDGRSGDFESPESALHELRRAGFSSVTTERGRARAPLRRRGLRRVHDRVRRGGRSSPSWTTTSGARFLAELRRRVADAHAGPADAAAADRLRDRPALTRRAGQPASPPSLGGSPRALATGSLALGPSPSAPSSPSATTGGLLDLDARRLDLGDDLVAVGDQGHVARDRQVANVDGRRRSRPAIDRVLDRLRAGGRAAPGP